MKSTHLEALATVRLPICPFQHFDSLSAPSPLTLLQPVASRLAKGGPESSQLTGPSMFPSTTFQITWEWMKVTLAASAVGTHCYALVWSLCLSCMSITWGVNPCMGQTDRNTLECCFTLTAVDATSLANAITNIHRHNGFTENQINELSSGFS